MSYTGDNGNAIKKLKDIKSKEGINYKRSRLILANIHLNQIKNKSNYIKCFIELIVCLYFIFVN